MADRKVKTTSSMAVDLPSSMDPEERVLLAAALAATLVDYRCQTRQNTGYCDGNQSAATWRTLGRWEQLRS